MMRVAAVVGCLGMGAMAHAGCSENFAHRAAAVRPVLDTLHPDKPGQMRVVAINGAAFSAGQVRWMTGQMHEAMVACQRSDERAAAAALDGVEQFLSSHQPTT